MSHTKHELRQYYRQKRRALSPADQRHHAIALTSFIADLPLFQKSERLFCYLANDGEINPEGIVKLAWEMGKETFLPCLADGRTLTFSRYTPDTPLQPNRFGIAEPVGSELAEIDATTLVLVPMVAFDAQGMRLGMGGGYYDRTFADTPASFLGCAHECQKTQGIPRSEWDIHLSLVVTEQQVYQIETT